MRIIAGTLGGRRLVAPRGSVTRPTADRVREAVFNILGPPPAHARVLDLYAGSGALALEALSRGADRAVLVDQDRAALRTAARNVDALGLTERVRLVAAEVGAALRRLVADGPFAWLFLDPPYGGGAVDRTLRLLGADAAALVAEEGVVIAEHAARDAPPADAYGPLALHDRRRWGEAAVSFYRRRLEPTGDAA